jgi:DNA polymerase III alpha subunit
MFLSTTCAARSRWPGRHQRVGGRITVERTTDGHAVRYALAGLRNVGEKAMDAIVAEREANGPFATLDDLFKRIPAGSMNRRQLEALAAAGALDCLDTNRAKIIANAELLMAVTDEAVRTRTSGQGGLFGGDGHDQPATRLVETKPWSRADQMAAERENFGFYFAAHPVEEYRAVASANGARTYGSLMAGAGEGGGGRSGAVMAALVENVQKRKTKRGKDFIMADFSDSSGLFTASCFEDRWSMISSSGRARNLRPAQCRTRPSQCRRAPARDRARRASALLGNERGADAPHARRGQCRGHPRTRAAPAPAGGRQGRSDRPPAHRHGRGPACDWAAISSSTPT